MKIHWLFDVDGTLTPPREKMNEEFQEWFRSFMLKKRSEETLGELFSFFVIETILIAKALKIDPYNQPAVELIKKETKKILIRS